MKKVQTSGKNVTAPVVDVEPSFIIAENGIEEVTDILEPAAVSAEVPEVQTSGKDKFVLSLSSSEMLFLNKLMNLKDVYYSDMGGLIRHKMIKLEYEWDYDCKLEGFELMM